MCALRCTIAVFVMTSVSLFPHLVEAQSVSVQAGPRAAAWFMPETVAAPASLGGQIAPAPTSVLISGPLTFIGAFAGSYAGQRIGLEAGGSAMGPTGVVIGTAAMSLLGSAAVGTAFSGRSDEKTFKRAAAGALGGLVLGFFGGWVGLETADRYQGWLVGFAAGQAALTTLAVHGG